MRKTLLLLLAAAVIFAGHLSFIYPSLPATVASHFGADGTPNGWMAKQTFLFVEVGLLIFVFAQLVMIPSFIRRLPSSMVNLPNKDYWLMPEHFEGLLAIIRRYFDVFGAAILILVTLVNHFVYLANVSQSSLATYFWAVIMSFLLFAVVWLSMMFKELKDK